MTTEQILNEENYLAHYGVLGMKWGVRRYETKSGHLTEAGKARYDSESYKKHGILKGLQSARTGPSRVLKRTIHDAKENHRINKEVKAINKERKEFAKNVKRRDKQNKHFGAKMGLRIGAAAAKTAISVAAGVGAAKLATEGGIAATLGTVGLGAAATFLRTSVAKTTNKAAYSLANHVIKDQYDIPVSQIPKKVSEEDVKRWEEKQREEAKKLQHSFENEEYLAHYGILGMKWGIRRYQNSDGSLTSAGKARYNAGGVKRSGKTAPSGTPDTSSKSVEQKPVETEAEMKARLMRNPNANEVAKNIDKFTTAELNEMANRSNALQRMRNDARMDEQYRKQQYKLEQEEALRERQDKIDRKLKNFKNYAEAVHIGVSLVKDAAYIAKTLTYGSKVVKSLKDKDTTAAFDYLIEWADGKQQKKDKNDKKEDSMNQVQTSVFKNLDQSVWDKILEKNKDS